jgi:2-methylisocitrate lyase-like PEP mutase family enzyme
MKDVTPISQQEKAKLFYKLHYSKDILVLPNIWDCLGAILLESLGYPAIATASAAVAFTNGYDDGEHIPFDELLAILKKIATSVNVPVTADIESGFADTEDQLKENILQLIQTGVAGINFEDTDKKTNSLFPVEIQSQRIKAIRKIAGEMNVPLFINARTDVYVRGKGMDAPGAKLEEAIKRGAAYKAAGADCFFPLAIQKEGDIKTIVEQLQMPVNIILIAGVPELNTLHTIGVKRVSLGPGFLKIAVRAMKNLAIKLRQHEGLTDIATNEITSDYLISLVNKK